MKRILTVLALGATLVLAAASCKKDNQPEVPRIAPQTWLTESPQGEGSYNLRFCYHLDGNGTVGAGYVINKEYAEYLHRIAEAVKDNTLKASLENAKEGDLVLTMCIYELTENADGISGQLIFKKAGKIQATVTYSELTVDSVIMSTLGTASEDTVVEPLVEKFMTPAALGIKIGNIIDITSLS